MWWYWEVMQLADWIFQVLARWQGLETSDLALSVQPYWKPDNFSLGS